MILHCLNCSPDAPVAQRLLGQLVAGDAVLLLGEAVTLAREPHPALPAWRATGATLYALADDLAAHGVTDAAAEISSVSYADWVKLTEQCATQVAWY